MVIERILVTGAAGFLGSEVVRQLRAEGRSVRGLVRSRSQVSELEKLGAEAVVADLKDPVALAKAVEGVSDIIHVAALFRQAGLPESEFFAVNVDGTRSLLESAIAANVSRFIHCSTVGVHGDIQNPPASESYPYSPGDMYQRSKTEGERLVLRYFSEGRIRGAVIRPSMIYGPHDLRTLKLFKMVANHRFFYIGAGDALVHFVDVRDVARGLKLALSHQDLNDEVFIIGGARALPLRTLISELCTILNVEEPWLRLPIKPLQWLGGLCELVCTPLRINPPIYRRRVDFYTKNRSFDCSKAQRLLGYVAAQDLHGELIDIVNSYIDAGLIAGRRLSQPATIVRDISGRVEGLDQSAERLYGFSSEHVTGQVSHDVFRTEFPRPLPEINSLLQTRGFWTGNLVHRLSSGQSVSVFSAWRLKRLECGRQVVHEVNRLRFSAHYR
jgi:dihydroflavonol-4-reductase